MKISYLTKLFNDSIDIALFKEHIRAEVTNYKLSHGKLGSSISIFVDDDAELTFTKLHFAKMCEYYLNGTLDIWELQYMADCITLRDFALYEFEDLVDFLDSLIELDEIGLDLKSKVRKIKEDVLSVNL